MLLSDHFQNIGNKDQFQDWQEGSLRAGARGHEGVVSLSEVVDDSSTGGGGDGRGEQDTALMITQDTTLTRTKDTMAGDVDDANDQAGKDNIDKDATFSCDTDISITAVDAFVLETMFLSLQLQSCLQNYVLE